MFSELDQLFMKRALDIAQNGEDMVSPNPMVGCVVVHNERVIAEGYHRFFGGPHAEVEAINAVKDKNLLGEATLYVSLEPCSHTGKTPPCAELLIKHKPKRVIVSNLDPNPLVAGAGIKKLKEAGIKVDINCHQAEGEYLNRKFFMRMKYARPFVTLKWAESADGFVAMENSKPIKISNNLVDTRTHKLRANHDAILIGAKTLITDFPKLDVRLWPEGRNPQVVILKNGSLTQNTFNFEKEPWIYDLATYKPNEIMSDLALKNINSVLIEGGPATHKLFLEAGLVDEIYLIKNKDLVLEKGIPAAQVPAGYILKNSLEIEDNLIFNFVKKLPTFSL